MSKTDTTFDDVVQKFDAPLCNYDIPEPMKDVMWYINDNTGLLDDYNDAELYLADAGSTIQWYPRGTTFSAHDNLLHAVQEEIDGVFIGIVSSRNHPVKDKTTGYVEIHTTEKWGYDQ